MRFLTKGEDKGVRLRGLTATSQAPKRKSKPRGETAGQRKTRATKAPTTRTGTTRSSPRRSRLRAWLRPTRVAKALAACLVVGLIGGGATLWESGWVHRQTVALIDAGYDASARFGLALGDLQVVGRKRTSREEILNALAVDRGTAILTIDPVVARASLEALPWIKSARVNRRLPDVLRLDLVEREPLAIWQLGENLLLLDQDGQVIEDVEARRFAGLPIVLGEGAPHETPALIAMLRQEPSLSDRVTAATWIGKRRWNVQLDGAIAVRLPEGDAQRAWIEFAKVEREHGLLTRDVIAVDLRQPDRVVVRTAPDSKPRSQGAGEET